MKIVSYNVNGIRAALNKGFITWLQSVGPDVICLQETKAMKEQVDVSLSTIIGLVPKKKGIVVLPCSAKESRIMWPMALVSIIWILKDVIFAWILAIFLS